ncbi:hypothetical protein C8J56DRAFT_914868 [Mycena floridula]|nr:hypothetical protein C8J56DRAFT_914868 [Mycena floridula]
MGITYIGGDLFEAPVGSILIHACNTAGSWGGGIAVAFLERYPAAFQVYRSHCQSHGTVQPADNPSGVPRESLGVQNGNTFTWDVNIAAGTSIVFQIHDSEGITQLSRHGSRYHPAKQQ